jgi:hypothetical protein
MKKGAVESRRAGIVIKDNDAAELRRCFGDKPVSVRVNAETVARLAALHDRIHPHGTDREGLEMWANGFLSAAVEAMERRLDEVGWMTYPVEFEAKCAGGAIQKAG